MNGYVHVVLTGDPGMRSRHCAQRSRFEVRKWATKPTSALNQEHATICRGWQLLVRWTSSTGMESRRRPSMAEVREPVTR